MRGISNAELERSLAFAIGDRPVGPEVCAPLQHFFRYVFPGAEITTLVSPMLKPYMNSSLRSVLDPSDMMANAIIRLMSQNILYVGDLVQLSRDELVERLGREHEYLAQHIEATLASLHLGLCASAPWWKRPTDYYRCAY